MSIPCSEATLGLIYFGPDAIPLIAITWFVLAGFVYCIALASAWLLFSRGFRARGVVASLAAGAVTDACALIGGEVFSFLHPELFCAVVFSVGGWLIASPTEPIRPRRLFVWLIFVAGLLGRAMLA